MIKNVIRWVEMMTRCTCKRPRQINSKRRGKSSFSFVSNDKKLNHLLRKYTLYKYNHSYLTNYLKSWTHFLYIHGPVKCLFFLQSSRRNIKISQKNLHCIRLTGCNINIDTCMKEEDSFISETAIINYGYRPHAWQCYDHHRHYYTLLYNCSNKLYSTQ